MTWDDTPNTGQSGCLRYVLALAVACVLSGVLTFAALETWSRIRDPRR